MAAAEGPVILIIISYYYSDAIIIQIDNSPTHVRFPKATPKQNLHFMSQCGRRSQLTWWDHLSSSGFAVLWIPKCCRDFVGSRRQSWINYFKVFYEYMFNNPSPENKVDFTRDSAKALNLAVRALWEEQCTSWRLDRIRSYWCVTSYTSLATAWISAPSLQLKSTVTAAHPY